MKNKIFFFALAMVLVLPLFALADAPPPPPFTVNFTYEGEKISDQRFYAETLRCDKEKFDPKGNVIPQLLIKEYDSAKGCTWEPWVVADNCANSQCRFDWTLGKFKIAVFIPSLSKVFISDEINRQYLGHYGSKTQTVYDVNLLKDGGTVVSNIIIPPDAFIDEVYEGGFWALLALSLLATIILESIVVLVFVLLKKAPKKIFFALLIGNIISVPLVWMFSIAFIFFPAVLYIAEIVAVIFEACLIRLFAKKTLSWKMSLLISLIMNVASFIVGPYLIILSGI